MKNGSNNTKKKKQKKIIKQLKIKYNNHMYDIDIILRNYDRK